MSRSSSIQADVKQTRPFASLEQEALISLVRTAWLARRQLECLMKEHGITGQQYNVLRILRGAGEPLPTMEVAERMIEPEPGITRLMCRLSEEGLVERERCPEDGRRSLASVTQKGLDLLSTLDEPILQLDNTLLSALSEDDLETLIDLLERVRASLPAHEGVAC